MELQDRDQEVNKKRDSTENADSNSRSWLKVRYMMVFTLFLLNTTFYIMRTNLSVAIVAIALSGNSTDEFEEQGREAPQYDWDADDRSMILSSFFWGYAASQYPLTLAVGRWGARKIVLVMILVSTVASFLFVPLASLGVGGAIAARVLLGIGQGAIMSSCHSILSRWAPPNERGRMTVYTYTGNMCGTVVALSSSGVISATAGWPVVFYVSGSLGIVLAIIWYFLVADTPTTHRFISQKERIYIEQTIGAITGPQKSLPIPWRAILTSVPFLALVVAQSAHLWGYYTLLTTIPSYMDGVLDFNLSANGFLSSLPYLAMWFTGLALSWISDYLLKRKFWSVGISRKVLNSLGHYGAAVMLIILGYSGNNPAAAVAILTLAVGVNAGGLVGHLVNHIDLSPNFGGLLMGLANSVASLMSIIGPLIVGFIVIDNTSAAQWRIVFFIAAAFYLVGNTLYVIFGSGKVQPWNDPDWLNKNSKLTDTESTTNKGRENPSFEIGENVPQG